MADTYPRIAALCRVLEDAGDMTPTATRLILKALADSKPETVIINMNGLPIAQVQFSRKLTITSEPW